MVTAYSQRDTEWYYDGLGTSPKPNMGEAGCLVTAMASIVTDLAGQLLSPGLLNDWLRGNKGFLQDNLFVFDSVAPLGLRRIRSIYASATPAPIADLADALNAGNAIVIEVDFTPGGPMNMHWVRLLSVDEKDGQIMDPWQKPGKEFVPLSTYFASGWDSARSIFIAHIYQADPPKRWIMDVGPESRALAPQPDDPGAYQTELCIRPPD